MGEFQRRKGFTAEDEAETLWNAADDAARALPRGSRIALRTLPCDILHALAKRFDVQSAAVIHVLSGGNVEVCESVLATLHGVEVSAHAWRPVTREDAGLRAYESVGRHMRPEEVRALIDSTEAAS